MSTERIGALVLAQVPAIVALLDLDGRILYVNPYFERVSGYTVDRVRGRDWFTTMLLASDRDRIRAVFLQATSSTPTRGNVNAIVTSSGEQRMIEWNDQLYRDVDGRVVGLLAVGIDVTARVLAEAAAQRVHERLQATMAAIPDLLFEVDVDGRIYDYHARDKGQLAVPPEIFLGRTFHDVLPETAADACVAAVRDSLATGFGLGPAYSLAMSDGERWYEPSAATKAAAGESPQRFVLLARDVTVRVHAQQALAQSEASLREAQRIAKLGNWELDLTTNVLRWSDEVFRIFEIDRTKFGASYEGFLALVHPEDRARVDDAYTSSLASRRPYSIDHRLRMPDGRIKHVVENAETSYDAAGTPLRSIGTVQDITERVEAEHRVRRIINAMFPYVAILDVEGLVVEVNQAPLNRYALKRDDRIGKRFVESPPWLAVPESQSKIRDAIARVRRGESVRIDLASQLPDGHIAYTDTMFVPLDDAQGSVENIIVSGIDVSDRKASEERLRESEERYRSVLNALSEAVVLLSKDRTIIACNDAARELFGIPRDVRTPRAQDDVDALVVAPDGSTIAVDHLPGMVALRTGKRQTDQLLGFRRRDGAIRWHSVNAEPTGDIDPLGGASSAVISFTDITGRVEAERALQQTRDRLEATLQAIPDLLFETDCEHRYVDFRAMRRDLLISDPAQFMTQRVSESLPADAWAVVREALEEAFERGASFGRVYSLTIGGDLRWFELSIARKNDSAGGPPTCVTLARDITDRKRAEQAIQTLNTELEGRVAERTRELEAANAELRTFTYSVSHDLKAPLRHIDGYAGLLIQDYGATLGADAGRMLRAVRDAASQMSQLIDDLLSYSQLERQGLSVTTIDVHAVIVGVLAAHRREIDERGVEVSLDVHCRVRADHHALLMALRNLVDNAVKFTRNVPHARIEIGETDREASCVLWVRDNGIGFDMKFHDRIFEIFQRLQRVENYPGTGVGLAIVRKATQRMGGKAWAQSEPGRGATFYLEIPK